MTIFARIEAFLLAFCPSSSPLLLALSGGPDSLCLFYALLTFRERYKTSFHVAHVDHGWRQESQAEAQALQQLVLQHQVPFHLKILNPANLKGNLEEDCRQERYAFFALLYQQFAFQAVLTGHHQDDQAETIFKRLLEGAHWSRWMGLKAETWIQEMRILRPLLGITKKEIQESLSQANIKAFEDPTNQNIQFLRARLRETIFPRLNREFGKEVQKSLIEMGREAQELTDYFDEKLSFLLEGVIQGPWGICLDLQNLMPGSRLEVKYLIRLLCQSQGFFLSRPSIEQAAEALQSGKANQLFAMGSNQVWIDRQRIFITKSPSKVKENHALKIALYTHRSKGPLCEVNAGATTAARLRDEVLQPLEKGANLTEGCIGCGWLGNWKVSVSQDVYNASYRTTSWKEGWKGTLKCYLPIGNYTLEHTQLLALNGVVKKRWSQAKVPAFLYGYFPLVRENMHPSVKLAAYSRGCDNSAVRLCDEGTIDLILPSLCNYAAGAPELPSKSGQFYNKICHEFLTGRPLIAWIEGVPCWRLELTYFDFE
jgi:tRNA(Ile)-lysidine synthase